MTAPSSEFNLFLADDESVIREVPGTLIDGSRRSEGSIGVTDRRILFLSNGGRFVDIAYDAIDSIQSRSRTTFTYSGFGYRLLVVLGALVATVAFLGTIAIGSSVLALTLMFVVVGGSVGAEYVRRYGVDIELTALSEFGDRLYGELDDGDMLRRHIDTFRRHTVWTKSDGEREPLALGLVFIALTAWIGLIALTGSLVAIPLVLVALGGITLTDYARRRKRDLDETGRSRRYEREVSIRLASSYTVHVRVDAATRIDHELSGVARETGTKTIDTAALNPAKDVTSATRSEKSSHTTGSD